MGIVTVNGSTTANRLLRDWTVARPGGGHFSLYS